VEKITKIILHGHMECMKVVGTFQNYSQEINGKMKFVDSIDLLSPLTVHFLRIILKYP